MTEYGFEQNSFQSTRIKVAFVTVFLVMISIWAMVLSPDHGGIGPAAMHEKLRMDFVNVGQGDAILIRTPRGRTYLVDGGMNVPSMQATRENRELIQNYLRSKRIRRLDGIVVTHHHNDHLGGINPVLKLIKTDRIWDCGSPANSQTYKEYVDLCEKKRIPRESAKAGDELDWGSELHVSVLHPEAVSKSQGFSDMNNMSVTLLIKYGNVSILLCGDIETEAEQEVARYGASIRAQIVKIPHHGSDTSIDKTFWNLVKPKTGIIQVGRDNPFGHPKIEATDLYRKLGTDLKRTDVNGTVRLEVGGENENDYALEVDRNL
ncbi:MAG TPA: ComEC/Rec2 family competence protein [Candidatus Ozemobacteraceae bacterium]|nr:ComEC/Rec2 family competence protein [Candidatus Ozemobacteraceae bacterium]